MEFGMFLLGLSPILWMIIALCGFKMAGYKASFVAMILAAILSISVWKLPVLDTATAALEGFAMAVWPIILVIIAAVFLYNLSLHTGKSIITAIILIINPQPYRRYFFFIRKAGISKLL